MSSTDEPERPDVTAGHRLLPPLDRPRTISAGVALLLAGAALWLLIILDGTQAGAAVGLPGLPVFGFIHLGCTIAVWHGGPRARLAVTVMAILCYVLFLAPLLGAGEPRLTVLVLVTGAVFAAGLVLIWRRPSSLFIAEATAARRQAVEQRRRRRSR
jgi:hypothetical protein